MTDHEANARRLAAALASTLDAGAHMSWCEGWYDSDPCDYPPCVRVREAVAMAEQMGYLPAKNGDKSGDSWYDGGSSIKGPDGACNTTRPEHREFEAPVPAPSISPLCAPAHPMSRAAESVGGAASPCPQGGPMTRA